MQSLVRSFPHITGLRLIIVVLKRRKMTRKVCNYLCMSSRLVYFCGYYIVYMWYKADTAAPVAKDNKHSLVDHV